MSTLYVGVTKRSPSTAMLLFKRLRSRPNLHESSSWSIPSFGYSKSNNLLSEKYRCHRPHIKEYGYFHNYLKWRRSMIDGNPDKRYFSWWTGVKYRQEHILGLGHLHTIETDECIFMAHPSIGVSAKELNDRLSWTALSSEERQFRGPRGVTLFRSFSKSKDLIGTTSIGLEIGLILARTLFVSTR